jgi:hypothetical protein
MQEDNFREAIMRFTKWTLAVGLASALLAGVAVGSDRGTPDEAKALVEKAAAHMKAVGPDKAIADFHEKGAGFIDRDLFVFVYNGEGKIMSGVGVPGLIGRSALVLKDVDGKEFGKEIMAAANGGGGWVEYRMSNPMTKKAERKTTYAVKVGDYVVAAGAYKP